MMVNKTVRFDEKQLKELIETAEENGLNFSDYIRKMIDFYQKSPTEMNENFAFLLQLFERQSEQIVKLTDMIIELTPRFNINSTPPLSVNNSSVSLLENLKKSINEIDKKLNDPKLCAPNLKFGPQ